MTCRGHMCVRTPGGRFNGMLLIMQRRSMTLEGLSSVIVEEQKRMALFPLMIMSAQLPTCHTQCYSGKYVRAERRDLISNLATCRCGNESHRRLKFEERQISGQIGRKSQAGDCIQQCSYISPFTQESQASGKIIVSGFAREPAFEPKSILPAAWRWRLLAGKGMNEPLRFDFKMFLAAFIREGRCTLCGRSKVHCFCGSKRSKPEYH